MCHVYAIKHAINCQLLVVIQKTMFTEAVFGNPCTLKQLFTCGTGVDLHHHQGLLVPHLIVLCIQASSSEKC